MRRGYVNGSSGQLHYALTGSGEALLLLGPAPRSVKGFALLGHDLSPKFQIIAVDQPGFGNSDPLPAGSSMELIAAEVVTILDALNVGSAHIFGLHTGAKIGAAIAARYPTRVQTLIVAGLSHSIIADKGTRNAAMLNVIGQTYFAGGAGPLSGSQAPRAWAALWRRVCSMWWSDTLHQAANTEAYLNALCDEIVDTLEARNAIFDAYQANFAFDFAEAIAGSRSPIGVIEITSSSEEIQYGRQGEALATLAANGRAYELPSLDPSGLWLYTGVSAMSELITEIIEWGRTFQPPENQSLQA